MEYIEIDLIRKLAVEKYGANPFKYGGQRDGFVEGYKKAMEQVLNIHNVSNCPCIEGTTYYGQEGECMGKRCDECGDEMDCC